MSLAVTILNNKTVHNEIRKLAKRTDNEYDDAGVEAIIALFGRIATLLGKKNKETGG
jgi:hypothetical protein